MSASELSYMLRNSRKPMGQVGVWCEYRIGSMIQSNTPKYVNLPKIKPVLKRLAESGPKFDPQMCVPVAEWWLSVEIAFDNR